MAAVTLGVGAADTTNAVTYATGSFTPAANDILLALAGCPATVDAGAYTSSDAGKTYGAVTSAVWATGANTFFAFVSGQKADNDSQTGTMDVTGDAAAGCAQSILRIAGMTKFSAAAIRQFKVADNQAPDTTPSITFDAACLTGNPTIMAISGSSTGTPTAPSGWTLLDSQTFATPTTGMKVWARDSGFTGTTITAGSASGAGYCLIAVELDASAGTGTMAATETGADDATAAGDVTVAGTLAATETGNDTFAGSGTVEQPAAEAEPPLTYGGGSSDYERRVRAKWDEIERLQAENREREAAEAERKRAIEARRQELAEIEAERSRRSAKKAQQARDAALRAIRDDIADMERQSALLRAESAAVAAEIERIQGEIAAAQAALMARRNAALALLLLAA